MPEHLLPGFKIKQRMSQAAVANVNLRGAHDPLARVAAPWTQATDQEQVDQQVDVARDSRSGGAAAAHLYARRDVPAFGPGAVRISRPHRGIGMAASRVMPVAFAAYAHRPSSRGRSITH